MVIKPVLRRVFDDHDDYDDDDDDGYGCSSQMSVAVNTNSVLPSVRNQTMPHHDSCLSSQMKMFDDCRSFYFSLYCCYTPLT